MDILVLGVGNIGKVIVYDLLNHNIFNRFAVADRDINRLEECVILVGNGVETHIVDAGIVSDLVRLFKGYELVVNALPGRFGYRVIKAAIQAGVDVIDVSYMPEDIFELEADISKAGIKVVPDAGVAPGLSNILVGHAVSILDNVNVVKIYVGGLPIRRVPPLDYVITWSVDDLIDEYTRRARIKINGEFRDVDALSGLEEIYFPGVGFLEAFYTDGLRTLLHTLKNVEIMWEKTLRYPGHHGKIMFLKDLGFFSEEPLSCGVSPRRFIAELLEKRLRRYDLDDLVVMKIFVGGILRGRCRTYSYYMLERGRDKHGFSAMARATGYTASVLTQLLIKGYMERAGLTGIIPPEIIGMNNHLFMLVLKWLRERGLQINWAHKEGDLCYES